MKLTFDKHRSHSELQRDEGKRPFRKMAIAGKVLAASALAGLVGLCSVCMVNFENEKKERATMETHRRAQDSLVYARGWAPIPYDGGSWSYENLRGLIASRHDKLQEAMSPAERFSILSSALEEFEWKMRLDMDPHAAVNKVDTAARRSDSLRMVGVVVNVDSEDIAELAGYMRKPDSRPGKRQRDSLISSILDRFTPMLPETRERGHDSVIVDRALSDVERHEALMRNLQKLEAILSDRNTLRSALRRGGSEREYINSMTKYKSLLNSMRVMDVHDDLSLREIFIHRAMETFQKVKEPDGRTEADDSLSAITLLKIARDDVWGAYVNDPRVVRITPGNSGGRYEPHVSEPPPAAAPSQSMPHWVGRE